MSMLLALAIEFSTVDRVDPITLEKQSVFAVEQEGDVLGLSCRPRKGEIEIFFAPAYYRGAFDGQGVWSPRADSRFGGQAKADTNAWYFNKVSLTYGGTNTNLWREVSATAEFIDRLATDNSFNIRWEASPDVIRTVSISYTLKPTQLREFVAGCAPKRVISKLKAMGSSASPE